MEAVQDWVLSVGGSDSGRGGFDGLGRDYISKGIAKQPAWRAVLPVEKNNDIVSQIGRAHV